MKPAWKSEAAFVRAVVERAKKEIREGDMPASWIVRFVTVPNAFASTEKREKCDLRALEAELQRKIGAYLSRMPKDRAPKLAETLEHASDLLALRHKLSTIDHRKKRTQIATALCTRGPFEDWRPPTMRELALISIVNGYEAPAGWRGSAQRPAMTVEQAINAEADAMRKAAAPYVRASEKK